MFSNNLKSCILFLIPNISLLSDASDIVKPIKVEDVYMYDLHTHTFFSDGVLVPSELVRRYASFGYAGVVLTDHVDMSNIETVLTQIVSFCAEAQGQFDGITILPGCELTHVPPSMIPALIEKARFLGAKLVIVHGETIVEPVMPGTNRAAISGGADVLAHPGLISSEDVLLAASHNVALEITSRSGHSYSNGHVAMLAKDHGATMVYSSDFHEPYNLLCSNMMNAVVHSAGLNEIETAAVLKNTKDLFLAAKE